MGRYLVDYEYKPGLEVLLFLAVRVFVSGIWVPHH